MIGIEVVDGVRVVRLERPEKRNALTVAMLDDLGNAFGDIDDAGACVLLGSGRVFCAGFDLTERVPGDDLGALRAQLEGLAKTVRAMRRSAVPVVIGVQGAAIAGGCALLGGGDVVIASRGAKVGYPVLRLGISPAVTAPYLRLSVGDGAVGGLLLDPELISAQRAFDLGLVHELVDDAGDVERRAMELGGRLASKPGQGVSETRRWLAELEELADPDCAGEALEASLRGLGEQTVNRLEKMVWKQ